MAEHQEQRHEDELSGYGEAGDDTLRGDNGNDSVCGDNGADSIAGFNGNDTLDGGNGIDSINGGSGATASATRWVELAAARDARSAGAVLTSGPVTYDVYRNDRVIATVSSATPEAASSVSTKCMTLLPARIAASSPLRTRKCRSMMWFGY